MSNKKFQNYIADNMFNKNFFDLEEKNLSVQIINNNQLIIQLGLNKLIINFYDINELKNMLNNDNGYFCEIIEGINDTEWNSEVKPINQLISQSTSVLNNLKLNLENVRFQFSECFPLVVNNQGIIYKIEKIKETTATDIENFSEKIAINIEKNKKYNLVMGENFSWSKSLIINIAECLWNFNFQSVNKKEDISMNIFIKEKDSFLLKFTKDIKILESLFLCKYLGITPANLLYPESYSNYIKKHFANNNNVKIEILGEKELEKLGMNAILSVGKGSARETKVVTMICGTGKKHICLIGKGVTFDTGGTNIKPGNFADMKYDMLGSTKVVSIMDIFSKHPELWDEYTLIGAIGLAENQLGSTATVPGDIVKSMDGKTIEILNTDAEGRVLLSDVITYTKKYVQDNYNKKPDCILVFATLTGSIVEALGKTYCGLFSNNEKMANLITEYGIKNGDLLWRMPCNKNYDYFLKNNNADIGNIYTQRRGAGSIKGAKFLEYFIGNLPFLYMDIAGVAYDTPRLRSNNIPTGFIIKTIKNMLEDKAL